MNLYELLPTIYRRRDAELHDAEQLALEARGPRRNVLPADLGDYVDDDVARSSVTPLKALLAVLQSQYDMLEADIAALYDDWFVETCSAGALPRLAEPFAIADLDLLSAAGADTRAIVANILYYRSTKGSAGAFEAYARDATRWAVRVADHLTTTSGTSRVDGGSAVRSGYPDLRRGTAISGWRPRTTGAGVEHAIGPRLVEVEVFRARAAPVTDATPGYADPKQHQRRTFSPLGDSKVLMRPADRSGQPAVPYTRADARAALAARAAIPGVAVREHAFFGAMSMPPLRVADLSQWVRPPGPTAPSTVFIDPELGRLLTPRGDAAYVVDYSMATNDGIGAAPTSQPWVGTYDRTLLVAPARDADAGSYRRLEAQLIARVLDEPQDMTLYASALSNVVFETYSSQWAVIAAYADRVGTAARESDLREAWPSLSSELVRSSLPTGELIEKLLAAQRQARDAARDDDRNGTATPNDGFERVGSFSAALRAAEAATGSVRIVLRGSRTHGAPDGGWTFRPKKWLTALSVESAPGARPTLAGSLRLLPETGRESPLPVDLRGLNAGAPITCSRDVALTVVSSTLRPAAGEHAACSIREAPKDENGTRLGTIRIVRSIVGGLQFGQHATVTVEDAIVTGAVAPPRQQAPGPKLVALRSTFLARVVADELTASDVLFDEAVTVRTRSAGYARYCAARPRARLPQAYKCVRTDRQLLASTRYGHLRFARLRDDAPDDVRAGGSTGSEIGAYGAYGESLRRANLRNAMAEYLPEGVSPHVVYRS